MDARADALLLALLVADRQRGHGAQLLLEIVRDAPSKLLSEKSRVMRGVVHQCMTSTVTTGTVVDQMRRRHCAKHSQKGKSLRQLIQSSDAVRSNPTLLIHESSNP